MKKLKVNISGKEESKNGEKGASKLLLAPDTAARAQNKYRALSCPPTSHDCARAQRNVVKGNRNETKNKLKQKQTPTQTEQVKTINYQQANLRLKTNEKLSSYIVQKNNNTKSIYLKR